MNRSIKAGLLVVFYSFPLTLNSTDIYHSSQWQVVIRANLNPKIVPGDARLGSTVVVVTAPSDRSDIHVVSPCEHTESILYKTGSTHTTAYVIELGFPTSCESPSIQIGDSEKIFSDTTLPLPMTSTDRILRIFMNTKSDELVSVMRREAQPLPSGSGSAMTEKLGRIALLYKNLGTTLESDMARDILHDREDAKYISPVHGYTLPKENNKLPGTGRPYRKDTTDGIHHGWDIMAPYGTPVQALSKGVIIRIVDNWTWSEFGLMGKWPFGEDGKLKNLDIFRGNQVWLQSLDGNVIFYSHLSKISPDITVGTRVEKWTYLGNIGTSGVPEKNYKDVHLHFEIQENPFHRDMKDPNFLDIMRWEYVGKWATNTVVREKTKEIFG